MFGSFSSKFGKFEPVGIEVCVECGMECHVEVRDDSGVEFDVATDTPSDVDVGYISEDDEKPVPSSTLWSIKKDMLSAPNDPPWTTLRKNMGERERFFSVLTVQE
jgi:hypothetical protein